MIAFTSDIDWAPEEVIKDMLSLFEQYNVKCTLFTTHYSEVINNCNRDLFEIALHPNFNRRLFNGDSKGPEEVLDELVEMYPEALGVRSHSMTQSTPLLDLFKTKGMKYDSNHFLPYQNGIKPFMLWNGLYRIPYNWEDDVHYLYGNSFDDIKVSITDNNVINVLDFHPIHVFLNTDRKETYDNAKQYYQSPNNLKKCRNTSNLGSRDALISQLKLCKLHGLENVKLIELYHLRQDQ